MLLHALLRKPNLHGIAGAAYIVVLLPSFLTAVFVAACNEGGAREGAPEGQSTPTSQVTPIKGALGSFDDRNDFLQFASTLETAVDSKDVKFFLSNTAYIDCSSTQCQALGPPPQGTVLPYSAYQSEGLYLTPADYERLLMEFTTNTGPAPDSIGGVEPKLFAYATPKRDTVFEQLRSAEIVEALVTRISGPLPANPQVPGLPNTRQVLSFGTTYRDGKWLVVFIRMLPSDLFLDPSQPDVAAMYDFWQPWGP
jgi:hypothetical protein